MYFFYFSKSVSRYFPAIDDLRDISWILVQIGFIMKLIVMFIAAICKSFFSALCAAGLQLFLRNYTIIYRLKV